MHWVRGKTLGSGGFGFVSIAKTQKESGDDDIPAVVAVKSADVSQSKSLSREKDLLNKFKSCPCILHCFGGQVTTENGQQLYNILLEYAPGGCLADRIHAGKGLPEHAVRHYTKSLLTALLHIHRLGYVHCDVKPQNVLLVGEETKLADFGSCKRINGADEDDDHRGFRGTVLYAAPESIAREEYSPESDVWALGCTVLYMLTGKAPWKLGKEATAKDVLMKIGCSGEIPAIPTGRKVSEEAKDFLRRCFVRDPRAREKAESLLNHPFVKKGDRRRHHHYLPLLSSRLSSFLPQCFHVAEEAAAAAVRACVDDDDDGDD